MTEALSRRSFLGFLGAGAAAGGLALYSEPVAHAQAPATPVPPPGPEQTQFVIRNEGFEARLVTYTRSEPVTWDADGSRWVGHEPKRTTSTILLPGEELVITTHPLGR